MLGAFLMGGGGAGDLGVETCDGGGGGGAFPLPGGGGGGPCLMEGGPLTGPPDGGGGNGLDPVPDGGGGRGLELSEDGLFANGGGGGGAELSGKEGLFPCGGGGGAIPAALHGGGGSGLELPRAAGGSEVPDVLGEGGLNPGGFMAGPLAPANDQCQLSILTLLALCYFKLLLFYLFTSCPRSASFCR